MACNGLLPSDKLIILPDLRFSGSAKKIKILKPVIHQLNKVGGTMSMNGGFAYLTNKHMGV